MKFDSIVYCIIILSIILCLTDIVNKEKMTNISCISDYTTLDNMELTQDKLTFTISMKKTGPIKIQGMDLSILDTSNKKIITFNDATIINKINKIIKNWNENDELVNLKRNNGLSIDVMNFSDNQVLVILSCPSENNCTSVKFNIKYKCDLVEYGSKILTFLSVT